MNETIAQLRARRSVRAYTDEPVSAADERAILEAACQAPTAGNQQLYSSIVVRDQRGHRRGEPGARLLLHRRHPRAPRGPGSHPWVPAPRRAGLAARDRAPHRGTARPRKARTAAALRHCVRGPLRGARRRAAARGPASQGAYRPRSCRMGARVLRAQVELGFLSRDDALGGRDSLRLCDGRLLGPGSRDYLGTFSEVGKVALGGWHFLTCGFTGASAVYTLGCSEKVPR